MLDPGSVFNIIDPSTDGWVKVDDVDEPGTSQGGDFSFCEVGYVILADSRGRRSKVYGFAQALPAGTAVLLGDHALGLLGLHPTPANSWSGAAPVGALPPLDLPASNDDAVAGSHRTELDNPVFRIIPRSEGLPGSPSDGESEDRGYCGWADYKMAEYMRENPDFLTEKKYSWRDVDINPDLPRKFRGAIEALLRKHASVFDTTDIPKLNKQFQEWLGATGVDVGASLKPGVRPTHVKRPKLSTHQLRYLDKWRVRLLAASLVKRNPNSPWAMRITIASKGDGSPRICLDLRPLNEWMKATRPEVNNGREELEKISHPMLRFCGDAISAFWQYPVDETSQSYFTFWLPEEVSPGKFEMCKYSFTRVPFGWTGSPGVLTEHMSYVHRQMKPETRASTAKFFDDWSGGALLSDPNCHETFLRRFDDFLGTLARNGVKLKAPKSQVGYTTGTFYGFDIAADGSNGLIAKYTEALDNLVKPDGSSSVRSLLGTLEVARNYLPNYAVVSRPLVNLTRKDVEFFWDDTHWATVDKLRSALKEGVRHYAMDPTLPLHLSTDASDDGWGAHLYQLVRATTVERTVAGGGCGVRYDEKGVLDPSGEFLMRTLAFLSKAWSPAMRRRPIFYREAAAALGSLKECLIYAHSNQHPVILEVDHLPLQWVKHNHKGAVTSFLLDELSEARFEVVYRPGTSQTMKVPDSLSRVPMIGPRKWSADGTENFYLLLRDECLSQIAAASSVWVYAGPDTRLLKGLVKQDSPTARIFESSPRGKRTPVAEFSVLVCTVGNAVEACAAFLRVGRPGACLVPTDLVNRVPELHDGSVDPVVLARLEASVFVGSLSSNFIWVVSGVEGAQHAVCMANVTRPAVPVDSPLGKVDVASWVGRQDFPIKLKDSIITDDAGLKYSWGSDGVPRLLVPEDERKKLIHLVHRDSVGHLGAPQTLKELRRRFYWDGMRTQVRQELLFCEACARSRGSRLLAHRNFRGVRYSGPRTFYSIDTKKFGEGHCLGVVDVFDGYTILIALPNKSAAAIRDALMDHVFLIYGFPMEIRSDAAREYGSILGDYLLEWGVTLTDTAGYHGSGNAHVERNWPMVKAAFKTARTMVEWRRQLKVVAFALNTAVRSPHGFSPFEVQFGLEAVTALHAATIAAGDDTPVDDEAFAKLKALIAANVQDCATAGDKYRRQRAFTANQKGRRSKPAEFAIGDLVMTFRDPKPESLQFYRKPKDFVPVWTGPWRITARDSTTYTLTGVAHGDGVEPGAECQRSIINLKKYTGAMATSRTPTGPIQRTIEVSLDPEYVHEPGQWLSIVFGEREYSVQPPPGFSGGSFLCQVDVSLEVTTGGATKVDRISVAAEPSSGSKTASKKAAKKAAVPRRRSRRKKTAPKRFQ